MTDFLVTSLLILFGAASGSLITWLYTHLHWLKKYRKLQDERDWLIEVMENGWNLQRKNKRPEA